MVAELEVKVAEHAAEIVRTQARGQADAVRIDVEGEAQAIVIKGEAQSKAQASINQTFTSEYIRYKAFDNSATRYYFVRASGDALAVQETAILTETDETTPSLQH